MSTHTQAVTAARPIPASKGALMRITFGVLHYSQLCKGYEGDTTNCCFHDSSSYFRQRLLLKQTSAPLSMDKSRLFPIADNATFRRHYDFFSSGSIVEARKLEHHYPHALLKVKHRGS